MISFEEIQAKCPHLSYKERELWCTAREHIDLCVEQFCPMMKERQLDEEPV